MDKKIQHQIEEILGNCIDDFNSKWSSHDEKNAGIEQYSLELVSVFNTQEKELLKLVSDQNHLKDLLDDNYEVLLSRDSEIEELKEKIERMNRIITLKDLEIETLKF